MRTYVYMLKIKSFVSCVHIWGFVCFCVCVRLRNFIIILSGQKIKIEILRGNKMNFFISSGFMFWFNYAFIFFKTISNMCVSMCVSVYLWIKYEVYKFIQ